MELLKGKEALVMGPGAPRVTERVLAAAPQLAFVGELEGDRFGHRIDLEAARARSVSVVDVTQGSSDPVAEWALGLVLIGLRNAGALFRRLIAGEVVEQDWKKSQVGYRTGELTGKRIGIVGAGFIGRRFIELLRPFRCEVLVHDPYAPRVLADALGFTFTSLDNLFSDCHAVVCTLPLTERTRGLIGAEQFGRMPPETVFVNVGRGAVVDTQALIERLGRGDVVACLDVLDQEPIPADSVLRGMENVFLSPHVAGVTAACGPRFVTLACEEMERFFAGHETKFDLVPRQ